ncbi:SpaA isopeptide-forming pilin-related protein [Sedimentibacter sp.]|uniref:SpaA isopeptide-forming pilin-related protein n=1 Tax=Sedimentibacter sp. TaxID=1960295 RepID=UPI00289F14E7|nr:SpaA isopeptide-forming pilin-related protein [Sedimentibacter sp.]
MEKIRRARGISLVLMFIMVFQLMMPVNFAYGDEIPEYSSDELGVIPLAGSTSSSAITVKSVEFKFDGKEYEEGDEVSLDAKVDFKIILGIEDNEIIDIDIPYTFNIAEGIKISEEKVIDIFHPDETDVQLATATIKTNGEVVIEFLDAINDYDTDREIWVQASGELDASELGDGGERELVFNYPGGPLRIPIKFKEKQEIVILEKEGSWDTETNEITWTIKVTGETVPSGGNIENVVITDVIGDGQEFISSNPVADADSPLGKYQYTFSELADGETKTITIVTKPDLNEIDSDDEDSDVTLTNTVSGTFGEDNKEIEEVEATVTTEINFIHKKNGELKNFNDDDRSNNYILWTIDINNNNLDMPAGTTLKDVIPEGLELVLDSVTIIGEPIDGAIINENANKKGFNIVFNSGLSRKATITYQTIITDDDAYEPDKEVEYENNAILSWDNGDEEVNDTGKVGIGRTVIQKSGVDFDATDNRYVKYRITVNRDRLTIVNPVVTDTLDPRLEFDSYTANPNIWTMSITSGSAITFSYSGEITTPHYIDIIAKIKDGNEDIYGANKTTTFRNDVSLVGKDVTEKNTHANQNYESTVIRKTNEGYDYIDREASWKIVVNQNKMTIHDTVIRDTIGSNHEFLDDSLIWEGGTLTKAVSNPVAGQYSVVGKEITINLGTITKQETITYKTYIPEDKLDEIFGSNDNVTISNSATITGEEIVSGGQNVTSSKTINNTVVGKKAKYDNNNDYIEWEVEINLNQLDFGDVEVKLEDELHGLLIFDQNSVKLYALNIKDDGGYDQPTEADLVEDMIEVDYTVNPVGKDKVEFKFLKNLDKAYLLKFTTDINSEKESNTYISNDISLQGHASIGGNSTASINVNFDTAIGGGGGSKTRGSVRIIKIDDYNTPIAGVEFELLDGAKNSLDPVRIDTTNADGIVYFDDLRMGTYYIREADVPDGYIKLDEDVVVTIEKGVPDPDDPKNVIVTLTNEKIVKDKIQVKKVDESGKSMSGVTFELYELVEDAQNKIAEEASDGEGFVVFDEITKGNYLIREKEAPEGYLKSVRDIYVKVEKIDDDDSELNITYSYDGDNYTIEDPTFVNTSIDIELKKEMDRGEVALPGATFVLKDEVGDVVDIAISGADGEVVFKAVKEGTYTIEETGFPEGYIQTPVSIVVTVDVNEDGTDATITFEGYEDNEVPVIKNILDVKGHVVIIKADKVSRTPLEFAEFGLYYDAESNEPIETSQSGPDGVVRFADITEGTYVIKEIESPAGYLRYDNVIYVRVDREAGKSDEDEDKYNVEYSTDGVTYSSETPLFENEPIDIEFTKHDSNGNPLAGAEFTLYEENGTTVFEDRDPVTSDDDGKVVFTVIPVGKYVIKETKAPSGYRDFNGAIEVEVKVEDEGTVATVMFTEKDKSDSGEVEIGEDGTLIVTNERRPSPPTPIPAYGKIAIKKTDEDKKVLPGAEFTLYDEDGKVVDRGVTGSDGTLSFEDLEPGSYTLKETKAPEGYVLEVDEKGVTVAANRTNTYTFTNKKAEPEKPGRIEIVKVDEEGRLLSEAWFSLIDGNGTTIENVVTVNGRAAFEDVPVGRYTVKEVQAPEGYVLTEQEVNVTVDSEETVTVRFVNKQSGTTVVPVSGRITINKVDENNMALAGAEFTLYNENNEIVGTAVSEASGRVIFENLKDGRYFVRETEAPAGYRLVSDSLTVNVTGGSSYSYRFRNVPDTEEIDDPEIPLGWEEIDDPDVPRDVLELPDTGSLLNTWLMITIGLMLIFAGMFLFRTKLTNN